MPRTRGSVRTREGELRDDKYYAPNVGLIAEER